MLRTRFHFEGGQMVTQRTQDCTPIVERTQALHKEGFHGSSEFKHAASIPFVAVSYTHLTLPTSDLV